MSDACKLCGELPPTTVPWCCEGAAMAVRRHMAHEIATLREDLRVARESLYEVVDQRNKAYAAAKQMEVENKRMWGPLVAIREYSAPRKWPVDAAEAMPRIHREALVGLASLGVTNE